MVDGSDLFCSSPYCSVAFQVDDLEQEHEWELQMQLRRQISAHAGTVQDALKRQEGELEAKFQARLQRRLDEERQRFNLQVASALGRVKGIEDAMNGTKKMKRFMLESLEVRKKYENLHSKSARDFFSLFSPYL